MGFSRDSYGGRKGERIILLFLTIVCFSVLMQIVTVEYLDYIGDIGNTRRKIGYREEEVNTIHGAGLGKPTNKKIDAERESIIESKPDITAKILTEPIKPSGGSSHHEDKDEHVLHQIELRDLEDLLVAAKVPITEEVRKDLPEKSDIIQMYGSHPVIVGLDRCEEFRARVKPEDAYIGPAGIFNTGTNLLANMLKENCKIPEKMAKFGAESKGIRAQAPWGKHSPVSWRHHHIAPDSKTVKHDNFLVAAVIKDPYTWMDSMCRHSYEANWRHNDDHCPNLVPLTPFDERYADGHDTVRVNVRYRDTNITHHESLADLWNDWYTPWLDVEFPRLIVRFEDLLFHAEEVVTKVCECGGGQMSEGDFKYIQDSAKKGKAHTGSNGFLKSINKYGKASFRFEKFQEPDFVYAKKTLNKNLFQKFRYQEPS